MICYDSIINYSMWVWFVGVAMGVTYVLEASSKKLAPVQHLSGGRDRLSCRVSRFADCCAGGWHGTQDLSLAATRSPVGLLEE